MRVLITNDDGIDAPGLQVAIEVAQALTEDVWVVAPERDQSGVSNAISLSTPMRVRQVSQTQFAVQGTPADCIIMAIRHLMPERPDLVLSGVNSGGNLADDINYSGTIAGAREASLLGLQAIALSQSYVWKDGEKTIPWQSSRTHLPSLLKQLIELPMGPRMMLNVNVPNCSPEKVDGFMMTRQATLDHGLYINQRADGRKLPYYWLAFERNFSGLASDSDVSALQANKISVTPLRTGLTDETSLQAFRDMLSHA